MTPHPSFFNNFMQGALLPYHAARLVSRQHRLLILSLLPLIITAVLYWYLHETILHDSKEWLTKISAAAAAKYLMDADGLTSVVKSITALTIEILFVVIIAFSFAPASNLAALPFNDLLAAGAERFTTPTLSEVKGGGLRVAINILLIDLNKGIFCAVGLLICVLMSWIPLINLLALLCGCLLLTFQYISYPQTRRGWKLRRSLAFMLRNLGLCLGFGLVVGIGFAVPLFAILMPPAAIVGGTMLFALSGEK